MTKVQRDAKLSSLQKEYQKVLKEQQSLEKKVNALFVKSNKILDQIIILGRMQFQGGFMTKSRAQMRIEQYNMEKSEWNDKFRENKCTAEQMVKEIDKLDKKLQ